ncbi:LuxR C-terminal-related transcriptional regulator [Roseateles sp. BYS180W]|uniref:LuxR C-terminal-related transcriptional regulator n=1 Tax=Roseateles rivi TaxID=3299028 RepID=A0ABW7FYA7_9BURK
MSVKVLIIEDNPVARTFLARVVRESFSDDMLIVEACDLESARHQVTGSNESAGNEFKLFLIDLELPDGNGLEFLADVASNPAMKVVTTLYSDDDHLFPALQRGADGYLLKEDRFEVLVEELQRIVRGQPPLSPAIARRLLQHFRPAATASSGEAPAAGTNNSSLGNLSATQHSSHKGVTLDPLPEWDRLTPRENQVLTYLSKGFTIKEIANLMGIKWFTVNDHIKSIYKKLNVSSRAEAAVLASKQGLV